MLKTCPAQKHLLKRLKKLETKGIRRKRSQRRGGGLCGAGLDRRQAVFVHRPTLKNAERVDVCKNCNFCFNLAIADVDFSSWWWKVFLLGKSGGEKAMYSTMVNTIQLLLKRICSNLLQILFSLKSISGENQQTCTPPTNSGCDGV